MSTMSENQLVIIALRSIKAIKFSNLISGFSRIDIKWVIPQSYILRLID